MNELSALLHRFHIWILHDKGAFPFKDGRNDDVLNCVSAAYVVDSATTEESFSWASLSSSR